MNRTIRDALALIVFVGLAVAPAAAAAEPELAGTYVAQGINPDGGEYRAFVQITSHGGSFLLTWMFPRVSGEVLVLEPGSIGVGIVSNGTLAVSYYTSLTAGVVVYRIEEDGNRLAGQWTLVGADGTLHDETLIRLPGNVAEPIEAAPREEPSPRRRPPAHSGRTPTL